MSDWPCGSTCSRLTTPQFAAALRRGLGRAVLHARDGLSPEALTELRRWYDESPAYDKQIEECRAEQIVAIADLSADLATVRARTLANLRDSSLRRDWYPGHHVVALAAILIDRGDEEIKQELWRLLETGAARRQYLGAFELVDGIDGLIRVASIVGADAPPEERWRMTSLFHNVSDSLQTGKGPEAEARAQRLVRDRLEGAAQTDERVSGFLRTLDAPPETREDDELDRLAPTVDAFIGYLRRAHGLKNERYPPAGIRRWARRVEQSEVERAAEVFEQASDPAIARGLSEIWWTGKPVYPRPIDVLVARAADPNTPSRGSYQRVLSHVDDERVRELALSLIECGDIGFYTLDMLPRHVRDEDLPLLQRKVLDVQWTDERMLHRLCVELNRCCEARRCAAWNSVARWVYEMAPSSFCRGRAFEFLYEFGGATLDLIEEAKHDADELTRELARGIRSTDLSEG